MVYLYTTDKVYYGELFYKLEKFNIKLSVIDSISNLIKVAKEQPKHFFLIDTKAISQTILADIINTNLINSKNCIVILNDEQLSYELKNQNMFCVKRNDFLKKIEDITNLIKNFNSPASIRMINSPKKRIYNLLLNEGYNMRFNGFNYLLELIELALEDFSNIDTIMTKGYKLVALKYNTTPSCVERAIRHLKNKANIKEKNKILIKKYVTLVNNQIL